MQQLSVAVIGAGMAGRTHANAWRQAATIYHAPFPHVRLATIADAYKPFAQSAAKDYGFEHATDNWRDIVEDPSIDIVSIVVANKLHREMAQALIEAGKHVLCEKPLTDTLEDAKAMAQLEAEADVVTGLGYTYRRNPGISQIARMVKNGDFGTINHFDARYWCDYGADPKTPIAWRYTGPMGSGALGDVGSHLIDTAEYVMGPIRSVSGARLTTVISERPQMDGVVAGGRGVSVDGPAKMSAVTNDDVATFTAEFENGVSGTFSCSRVAFGYPNALMFNVIGTQATAGFDMARAGEITVDDQSGPEHLRGQRRVLVNPEFPYFKDGSSMAFAGVGFTQIDQFTIQAHAFIQQVLGIDDGLPKLPSFAHGYRSMRIQQAIARSAADGGTSVTIE
ncbi:Gfo/Idh/MocA family protein [Gleimia hominis]|uniref:Gfo/Idh/MocA family protein n=1 Tax=Gleimia hominis TaxID=595468 RepID=UPI000C7F9393|nr:Gfo/Idh/MocA family oxidoreductase [Gleimia hominis]WIK64128.1 Gfo/Idh/MocA family oxidoreductase [Gleimia hominis]